MTDYLSLKCERCRGRALALRSLCDGHHKKALFIAELHKNNRAFLTAPAPAGISNDLMQSQEATDVAVLQPRRLPNELSLQAPHLEFSLLPARDTSPDPRKLNGEAAHEICLGEWQDT